MRRTTVRFADRRDAGRQLAAALLARAPELEDRPVVVLGLPRGGVPVAAVVAEALDARLDVIVVRKLGVPSQPELALGAIGEVGVEVLDRRVLAHTQVSADEVAAIARREQAVLAEQVAAFRGGRARVPLEGAIAVVVDDGLATGSTARAACRVARQFGAASVLLAVPVGAADTVAQFADADRVLCLVTPEDFWAVGQFYDDFSATPDAEVVRLMAGARSADGAERNTAPKRSGTN